MVGSPEPYEKGTYNYIYSRNCGLDWNMYEYPEEYACVKNTGYVFGDKLVMGASEQVPWTGRYVTLVGILSGERRGTCVMYSDIGPGDQEPHMLKVCDDVYGDIFQPKMLEDCKRIITSAFIVRNGNYCPTVFYSDDNAESWNIVTLKSTPKHIAAWPHMGTRWQNNGAEPSLTRLSNGRLMLVARTSLDYLYLYYSDDNGETWTDGEQSSFHATLTTPYITTLSDGRALIFWNNTRPLSEPNHELTWPPADDLIKSGNGEDAFTNRDAIHVAITEDGINWIGFRELALNQSRNAPDFRVGGSGDNSVQQCQAMELPYGKLLVSYGQHQFSRRTVIFDIDWIYEKERTEDFRSGLSKVSTHLFVKSISGCHKDVYPGHCAWNRTNGALLMPDPTGNYREALQLCRVCDKRLVSELQGVVCNFPKAYKGEIKLSVYLVGEGMKVRLCDHWMNAGDPDVGYYALFDFTLDKRTLPIGDWKELKVKFDTVEGKAHVFMDGKLLLNVQMRGSAPNGLSYVHLQTAAEHEDFEGIYINKISCIGE